MSDFHQPATLVTLHLLEEKSGEHLDAGLEDFTKEHPIALLLPCHAGELGAPGLEKILGVLREVRYLSSIFVGLDAADDRAFDFARREFSGLPAPVCLLRNNSPEILDVVNGAGSAFNISPTPGKGRNLWLLFGAALAWGNARAFVAHDCDIQTYSRAFLARLCFPMTPPGGGFSFGKGYGARFTDRMHGRVMRLLLTPLLRALRASLPGNRFLDFLDSFRYPLSGEFGIAADTARQLPLPCDWGVDLAILAEAFGRLEPDTICQVECCMRFEHKHRDLVTGKQAGGLDRMAGDVALRILQTLHRHGAELGAEFFENLPAAYRGECGRLARAYEIDSRINGLYYDPASEDAAVKTFERSIADAIDRFLPAPGRQDVLPSWELISKTVPDIWRSLATAVRASFL